MKIGILGELTRFEELKQTLPANAAIIYNELKLPETFGNYDFVFDLNFDDHPTRLDGYLEAPYETLFVLSSALLEIQSLKTDIPLSNNIFGMNCIPSFMHRKVKEISYRNEAQKNIIPLLEQKLGWEIAPVKDRVGMVTPRILFMIINEAYYTLQEGTASKTDIDTGMKLGTNYPFGPFEWSEKIGIKTVVKMLQNIYDDTKDERYKICSLLKSESYQA
ncbi:MAG: 3-hydroxyacyl-CoA dehydrogenase family protein [Bacteroidetes bacterium]|nr:3-hydroxyacyl-CoA dehydrogenase family protein [Bacteroidota bacterium]